jgi:hypothetical protein
VISLLGEPKYGKSPLLVVFDPPFVAKSRFDYHGGSKFFKEIVTMIFPKMAFLDLRRIGESENSLFPMDKKMSARATSNIQNLLILQNSF